MLAILVKIIPKIMAATLWAAVILAILFLGTSPAEELTNDYGYYDNYGYDPYYSVVPEEPETAAAEEYPLEAELSEPDTVPAPALKEPDQNAVRTSDVSGRIHILKMSSGEGEAVLLESGGQYALIGAGNVESVSEIRRQLWEKGVATLDMLLIPDYDPGFTGGISYLMDNFQINKIYIQDDSYASSEISEIITKAQEEGIELIGDIPEGYQENLGRFAIQFLNCHVGEENKGSYCLYVSDDYGNTVFLSGNLNNESGDEAGILQSYPGISSTDILITGYQHKQGYAFIQYLDPACCILSGTSAEGMEQYTGTRADLGSNFFYASYMPVTAIMGDIINVECASLDEETGEVKALIYQISSSADMNEKDFDETEAKEEKGEEADPADPLNDQNETPEGGSNITERISVNETIETSDEEPVREAETQPADGIISTGLPDSSREIELQKGDTADNAAEQYSLEVSNDPSSDLITDTGNTEPGRKQESDTLYDQDVYTSPDQHDLEEPEEGPSIDPGKEYYTVSFDTNGRGNAPSPQTIQSGNTASDPGIVESEGLTFAGWFSDKAFNNYYSFNTPVTEDTVLFARWTVNTYKILFDPNGASGSMQPQEISYGAHTELKANSFFLDDHEFAGWCTQAYGNGTWYQDREEVYNLSSEEGTEITMYAQWRELFRVMEGNRQVISAGNREPLEFTLSGSAGELESIILDGRALDPVEYTIWEDSGIRVRISDEVVKELSDGEHMVSFLFNGHELRASFIKDSQIARTGDTGAILKWLFAGAGGIFLFIICVILIVRNRRPVH